MYCRWDWHNQVLRFLKKRADQGVWHTLVPFERAVKGRVGPFKRKGEKKRETHVRVNKQTADCWDYDCHTLTP